jgi:hypothetical protein
MQMTAQNGTLKEELESGHEDRGEGTSSELLGGGNRGR